MIPLEFFEGQSADGRFVPIVPGGSSIPLTFENRRAYVDCAIAYRLHEMDLQASLLVFFIMAVISSFTCYTCQLQTHPLIRCHIWNHIVSWHQELFCLPYCHPENSLTFVSLRSFMIIFVWVTIFLILAFQTIIVRYKCMSMRVQLTKCSLIHIEHLYIAPVQEKQLRRGCCRIRICFLINIIIFVRCLWVYHLHNHLYSW